MNRMLGVSAEILWISPVFNLLLFASVGIVLSAVNYLFPNLKILQVSVFLFVFMSVFSWLGLSLINYVNFLALVIFSLGIAAAFTRRYQKADEKFTGFWRRSLPILIGVVLLLWIGIQGSAYLREKVSLTRLPEAKPQSPNVLFVVIDTLRADHLSSYNYQRLTSPNIDRIGREGAIFKHAISTSSYTLPSHVSLITGQYNFQHGSEWDTFKALKENPVPTLAEVLKEEGYRTAGFSANLFWVTREQGFDRGFLRYEDFFTSIMDMMYRTAYGRVIEKHVMRRIGFEDIPARKRAEDINNAVLDWVRRSNNAPYFIFINYMDAHDPYLPPQPYREMYSELKEPGGVLNCSVERCDPALTPEERQAEIDAYDGAINYLDENFNDLLVSLKESGNLDNTVIVITSDHGEAFNEHSLYLHGNSLYLEEIHVPLFFWWPGQIPGGAAIEQPVTNAAISATLFDLLDIQDPNPQALDSLRNLWEGKDQPANKSAALSEISKQSWKPERAPVSQNSIKSITDIQGHLISNGDTGIEFYDWKNDPGEIKDLSGEFDDQGSIKRIIQELENLLADN